MKIIPAIFEEREIRRFYDEKTGTWFFSVVDIVQILTQQSNYQTLPAADGKNGSEGSAYVTWRFFGKTVGRGVQQGTRGRVCSPKHFSASQRPVGGDVPRFGRLQGRHPDF